MCNLITIVTRLAKNIFKLDLVYRTSRYAAELQDLLHAPSRGKKFAWTEEYNKAYDCLKKALLNPLSLFTADLARSSELHVWFDSSSKSRAAILLQRFEKGEDGNPETRLIDYFSKRQ